jgi:hypothetical protein
LPFTLGFSPCLQIFGKKQSFRQRFARLNSWKNDLLHDFSGDFDNYFQVVKDRESGKLPREGGGHEHIHCTLIPLSQESRLAAFYFDGLPQCIFRFRYYELNIMSEEDSVEMKLYTLEPSLEQELRATMDPMEWPRIFETYSAGTTKEALLSELPKCNVRWTREMDPIQHSYALEQFSDKRGHHAVMIYGEAIVDSTMFSDMKILIRDQLSLWQDEFWIHDRGYNPDTGDYIYGNQRGVPYQLKRVTRINKDGTRQVVNADLSWTLGLPWRTPKEYEIKMAPIGGISSKLNSD